MPGEYNRNARISSGVSSIPAEHGCAFDGSASIDPLPPRIPSVPRPAGFGGPAGPRTGVAVTQTLRVQPRDGLSDPVGEVAR
jgi:hypothetical protein